MDYEEIYDGGKVIIGFIAFVGLWIYAFSEWGFLIGLAIGWLPAMIGAGIIAFLWPLIVLAIIVLVGFIYLS